MLNSTARRHSGRPRIAAIVVATALIAALVAFVGPSPVSAADKDLSLGDNVSFNDGSPASGVKVDVFEAASRFDRSTYLASTFTDANGNYRFDVAGGCYITVAIAPLGSNFQAANSGEVYDQLFGCVEDGPNNDFDSVLFREDVKPPPTTVPPTTLPPTTLPPTTAPPTTAPPTTLPPTTVPPTTQPPVTVPPQCIRTNTPGGFATWTYAADRGTLALHIAFKVSLVDPSLSVRDFDGVDIGPLRQLVSQFGQIEYANVTTDSSSIVIQITTKPGLGRPTSNPQEEVTVDLVFGKNKYQICFKTKWTSVSPVGLDVDQSGSVERVNADVEFDFAGNGEVATASEWFAPTEGILFDTRIEGPITGAHLFGDQNGTYADGFEKLALLDTNADGQVAGAELDGLAIWTDANTNGVLDQGEQSSLADHGIVSLSTSHTNMVSTAALADGTTMMTEDLWFSAAGVGTSTSSTTSLVLFGLGGLGLLGYAVVIGRRRRVNMDAGLAALVSESSMK